MVAMSDLWPWYITDEARAEVRRVALSEELAAVERLVPVIDSCELHSYGAGVSDSAAAIRDLIRKETA